MYYALMTGNVFSCNTLPFYFIPSFYTKFFNLIIHPSNHQYKIVRSISAEKNSGFISQRLEDGWNSNFSKAFYEPRPRNQMCYFTFCIGNQTKLKWNNFFIWPVWMNSFFFPWEGCWILNFNRNCRSNVIQYFHTNVIHLNRFCGW